MKLAKDQYSVTPGGAKVMSAVYRHTCRCEDGFWRFAHLHVHTPLDLRLSQIG